MNTYRTAEADAGLKCATVLPGLIVTGPLRESVFPGVTAVPTCGCRRLFGPSSVNAVWCPETLTRVTFVFVVLAVFPHFESIRKHSWMFSESQWFCSVLVHCLSLAHLRVASTQFPLGMDVTVAKNAAVSPGQAKCYKLLAWLNDTLQAGFTELEHLHTGKLYHQNIVNDAEDWNIREH